MSRDLSFWKNKTSYSDSHACVYARLSDGEFLDYLEEIPMEKIIHDFDVEFSSWKSKDEGYFEKGDEAFELMITNQFVRVDCYSVSEYNMNKIIDIMLKYGCPLYDSAINVRFDENNN